MENFTSAAPEYDPNQACLDPEEEARFDARLKVAAEVAKKHGYYFSVLGEDQRIDYVIALADGEGEEIALLKSEVKATKSHPSLQCLSLCSPAQLARPREESAPGCLDAHG